MSRARVVALTGVALAAGFAGGYFVPRTSQPDATPLAGEEATAAQANGDRRGRRGSPPPTRFDVASPRFDALGALPYVDARFDPESDKRGVVRHRSGLAFKGLNFYNSRKSRQAFLVDMNGDTVHSWSHRTPKPWQSSELLPNGDILVIVKDLQLLRLDKDSRLLWQLDRRVHHDLSVVGDRIYVLTRRAKMLPRFHAEVRTWVEYVTVLDDDGEIVSEIDLLDVIATSPYAYLLPSVANVTVEGDPQRAEPFDVLHANHVEVFDGRLAHVSSLFAAGNLLVSCRSINAILILDADSHEILWLWGPSNVSAQHHPRLIDNGHLLIFDNGVYRSRVVEVEVPSGTIVWEYSHDGFYSPTRGSVQRLPNGNTLVTDSDSGYVFEVTPRKKVVWRFANPDVSHGERAVIWRMTRFTPEELPFLDGL